MGEFLSKKNIITYLVLAILILAIPLTVRLVQTQLNIKPKAAGGEITFPKLKQDSSGNFITTDPKIEVSLDFGQPAQ